MCRSQRCNPGAIGHTGATVAADRSSIPVIAKEDTNLQGVGGAGSWRACLLTRHTLSGCSETLLSGGNGDASWLGCKCLLLTQESSGWREKQVSGGSGLGQEVSKNCGVRVQGCWKEQGLAFNREPDTDLL